MIGHCLGAAGGLEAIATVKAIETGWLHPSINQFVRSLFLFNNLISDNVKSTVECRRKFVLCGLSLLSDLTCSHTASKYHSQNQELIFSLIW